MCGKGTSAYNKIDKQSKPNKITLTVEIKWQRLREERCKHKNNPRCVILVLRAILYWLPVGFEDL